MTLHTHPHLVHHHHRHVKLEIFSRNASHDAARGKLIGF
jgi:hypothetical protein